MRLAGLLLLLILPTFVSAQGLLKSYIVGGDTVKVTLTVRDFEQWDDPVEHVFIKGTVTYLTAGDHLVRYEAQGRLIHTEWVHVTSLGENRRWLMEKWVLLEPRQLTTFPITGNLRLK